MSDQASTPKRATPKRASRPAASRVPVKVKPHDPMEIVSGPVEALLELVGFNASEVQTHPRARALATHIVTKLWGKGGK